MRCRHAKSVRNLGYVINALTNGVRGVICAKQFNDKRVTKKLLQNANLPTPKDLCVKSLNPTDMVVLKPCCSTGGDGVKIGPASEILGVCAADGTLRSVPEGNFILEEYVSGQHYRIVVYNGQILGALLRTPARVTGDGVSTVRELIEKTRSCRPLKCDDTCSKYLNSIPAKNEVVQVNKLSNYAKGGSLSIVEKMDRSVHVLCWRLWEITRMPIFGVDLIAADISLPLSQETSAVNELELYNNLDLHYVVGNNDVVRAYMYIGQKNILLALCIILAIYLIVMSLVKLKNKA